MPYKLRGRTVLVMRNGKWQKLKVHANVTNAKKHLAALNINVRHRRKRKKNGSKR